MPGKIDALLSEKLKGVEWGEFRLGDLFEFKAIKQAKSQREIPTDTTENGIPYIVQSMSNNMLSRTVNKKWLIDHNEAPVSGNRIVLGVTLPAVSYQPREFAASQVITAKADWLNGKNGIFISSAISKLMYQFSYSRKPGMQIYKEMVIHLPTKNGKINFDFMESFIAELEAERIAELEAYLSATGLKDYQLTPKEQAALDAFHTVPWDVFKIEDVLDWQKNIVELDPLKLNLLSVSKEKKYPFYGQSTTNNGIIEYRHLKDDVLNNKQGKSTILIHSNNQNTVYLDTPFYLKDGHGATSVLQAEQLDKMTAQFFMGSIKKVILQKYSYNAKATKIELKNTTIRLPVKTDNTPDYDYMRLVVSAIQKLVIKDVVGFADKKIATYHEVIAVTQPT